MPKIFVIRILELYLNRATEIFTGFPPLNTLKRIIFGSMYSTQKLHHLIAEENPSVEDEIRSTSRLPKRGKPSGCSHCVRKLD
jgi:hypothetical protein